MYPERKIRMSAEISERDRSILREKFPDEDAFRAALARLENCEPLAYIIGEWYFYDEVYKVSPACLIPRPETEHVVEFLIKNLPPNGFFADLCTGSGCIAISTLVHRPDCRAVAVDISESALAVAKVNAESNGVSDRITFIKNDITAENALGSSLFDAIASNPPYINSGVIDTLQPEVLKEPRIALDGGSDGLDFYRTLLGSYRANIKPGGFLVCEIGFDHGQRLRDLCGCGIKKDYSGNDRVMILRC